MLSRDLLQRSIRSVIEQLCSIETTSPAGVVTSQVGLAWARAYQTYSATVQAGPLFPILGTLQSPLIASAMAAAPTDFIGGISLGLELYWTAALFFGPGFIPTNPCTPGTYARSLVEPRLRALRPVSSRDDGASQITDVLHTYTVGILVTSTTIPPASVVNPAVPLI